MPTGLSSKINVHAFRIFAFIHHHSIRISVIINLSRDSPLGLTLEHFPSLNPLNHFIWVIDIINGSGFGVVVSPRDRGLGAQGDGLFWSSGLGVVDLSFIKNTWVVSSEVRIIPESASTSSLNQLQPITTSTVLKRSTSIFLIDHPKTIIDHTNFLHRSPCFFIQSTHLMISLLSPKNTITLTHHPKTYPHSLPINWTCTENFHS